MIWVFGRVQYKPTGSQPGLDLGQTRRTRGETVVSGVVDRHADVNLNAVGILVHLETVSSDDVG